MYWNRHVALKISLHLVPSVTVHRELGLDVALTKYSSKLQVRPTVHAARGEPGFVENVRPL